MDRKYKWFWVDQPINNESYNNFFLKNALDADYYRINFIIPAERFTQILIEITKLKMLAKAAGAGKYFESRRIAGIPGAKGFFDGFTIFEMADLMLSAKTINEDEYKLSSKFGAFNLGGYLERIWSKWFHEKIRLLEEEGIFESAPLESETKIEIKKALVETGLHLPEEIVEEIAKSSSSFRFWKNI